jgi:hypothetical protein
MRSDGVLGQHEERDTMKGSEFLDYVRLRIARDLDLDTNEISLLIRLAESMLVRVSLVRAHCEAMIVKDKEALRAATDSAMVLCAGTRQRAHEVVLALIEEKS